MNRKIILFALISLYLFFFSDTVFPWEGKSHSEISSQAIGISQLPLYVENVLGFSFLSKRFLGPSQTEFSAVPKEFGQEINYTAKEWIMHGSQAVEFIESGDTEFKVRLTGEGIYSFTAEATDDQSNIYTDTVAVLVMDEATLDALLQAKWDGMKAALSSGEIEEAVGYLTQGRREMYEYNFTLMSAYLAEISAGLQNIELVLIKDGVAEYEMWAEQDGQMHSFYILFVQDRDGIWRIQFF